MLILIIDIMGSRTRTIPASRFWRLGCCCQYAGPSSPSVCFGSNPAPEDVSSRRPVEVSERSPVIECYFLYLFRTMRPRIRVCE